MMWIICRWIKMCPARAL